MRRAVVAVLAVAVAAAGTVPPAGAAVPQAVATAIATAPEPAGKPAPDPSQPAEQPADAQGEPAEVDPADLEPFVSEWGSVPEQVDAVGLYVVEILEARADYIAGTKQLRRDVKALQEAGAEVAADVDRLTKEVEALDARLRRTSTNLADSERSIGSLARSIYQLPGAELAAFAQLMEGEDLRPLENQDLLRDVLLSSMAERDALLARQKRLAEARAATAAELGAASTKLADIEAEQSAAQEQLEMIADSLAAIAIDVEKAGEVFAGSAAAEAAVLVGTAVGDGVPSGAEAPTDLPADVPFRAVFIQFGSVFGVDPALLAAIAAQESGFDPDAGCQRGGGGKGLMQHEGQSQYCGAAAVPLSVAKSAAMLASYYRQSGSWNAAVFAYNNGPALMGTWVANEDDPPALLAAITAFYEGSYGGSGPYRGYSSWGAWRARVAFSYASAEPIPGFHSVIQRWLAYRGG